MADVGVFLSARWDEIETAAKAATAGAWEVGWCHDFPNPSEGTFLVQAGIKWKNRPAWRDRWDVTPAGGELGDDGLLRAYDADRDTFLMRWPD